MSEFQPGHHHWPLRACSPPPAPLASVPTWDGQEVEVVLRSQSTITDRRGDRRSLHPGRARLPLDLARSMIAAGSARPADSTASWARGIHRMVDAEGHAYRVIRGPLSLKQGD